MIRQQVRRASAIWVDGGRSEADLYRGRRLDATVEWRDTTHPDLTAAEAEFLDASVAEAARERDALTEQARHQARQNRRLRVALGIGAVLLVVAAATSVVAVGQRDRAERSVAEARAAETVAEARRISTLALTVENLDQALLLAVEAVHLHDSNDTRSNLFAVLNRSPQAFAVVGPPAGDPLFGMATIDGGRSLAVARDSGVELLDADTLRPTGRSLETRVDWGDAASTPDGAHFAVLDMSLARVRRSGSSTPPPASAPTCGSRCRSRSPGRTPRSRSATTAAGWRSATTTSRTRTCPPKGGSGTSPHPRRHRWRSTSAGTRPRWRSPRTASSSSAATSRPRA